MTTTESAPWQQLVSMELDQQDGPRLRISGAGRCSRALVYAAQGLPESDPPDPHGRNRMALGHMAEVLIIRDLESRGWETAHTVLSEGGQLELTVNLPQTGFSITGHPDGICRHPEFTKNLWVTLECKSLSASLALRVEEKGVFEVYPHYQTQICLYAHELHRMGLVSQPDKGLFAMMDRDGRPLSPERVSWDPETADRAMEKLETVIQQAQADEIPERPHLSGSLDCRYCNYHGKCRSPRIEYDPPENGRPASLKKDDPKLIAAAEQWLEAKPQVDDATALLREASDRAGKADLLVGEKLIAGYFKPRDPPVYDPEALARLVPADILRKCRAPWRSFQRFWVRTPR